MGLLSLQRFGNAGIRWVLSKHLDDFFAARHPSFAIHLNPVVHPGQLKELSSGGSVRRITFRQTKLPTDLADYMKVNIDPKDAYVEYSIVAKRKSKLAGFGRFLAELGSSGADRPHIIEPRGFKDSRVLVEVKLGSRVRTLDISNLSRIRSHFDITGEVSIAKDGHPQFASIKAISEEVVEEIFRSMTAPHAV